MYNVVHKKLWWIESWYVGKSEWIWLSLNTKLCLLRLKKIKNYVIKFTDIFLSTDVLYSTQSTRFHEKYNNSELYGHELGLMFCIIQEYYDYEFKKVVAVN